MTVEDLLRHTSGLVYRDLGDPAGRKLYQDMRPTHAGDSAEMGSAVAAVLRLRHPLTQAV